MSFSMQPHSGTVDQPSAFSMTAVRLYSGDAALDQAFRIALGDLAGNIVPFKDGLLDSERAALLAGLDYDTPWTRDTAINTWNGTGLLFPPVTYNTLLSVLTREGDTVRIGGQYWDAIIWALGAWWQYVYTGDAAFLSLAFAAVRNSLASLEASEFSPELNLFRGPACYGDGVAAYPDIYAHTNGSSSILDWPAANPGLVSTPGYGLPMHALSTNCLYYEAYVLLERMARELGLPSDPAWSQKAQALKDAINTHFWHPATGSYRYLVDPFGNSECQEGMGHAFALLFGIANKEQADAVLRHQHITAHGISCVWPPFARYNSEDGMSFGRHCGVVWPHIAAFWAQATLEHGRTDLFANELYQLAHKACRDSQFAEIYHPLTGAIYGGAQEGRSQWKSCSRQSWSATGYLRMIFMGLFGMRFDPHGITFSPTLLDRLDGLALYNLPYRSMLVDIEVRGQGERVLECAINGKPVEAPILPAGGRGRQTVVIHLGES